MLGLGLGFVRSRLRVIRVRVRLVRARARVRAIWVIESATRKENTSHPCLRLGLGGRVRV